MQLLHNFKHKMSERRDLLKQRKKISW